MANRLPVGGVTSHQWESMTCLVVVCAVMTQRRKMILVVNQSGHVCHLHAASLDNQILCCYRGDKAAWPSCQGHPGICRADKDNVESGSGVSDIEKSKVHQGPEKVPGPGVKKFLAVEMLPSSILVMCSCAPPPPSARRWWWIEPCTSRGSWGWTWPRGSWWREACRPRPSR